MNHGQKKNTLRSLFLPSDLLLEPSIGQTVIARRPEEPIGVVLKSQPPKAKSQVEKGGEWVWRSKEAVSGTCLKADELLPCGPNVAHRMWGDLVNGVEREAAYG